MIYGLDVDYFNCDRVFNLVCSYGDCLKVSDKNYIKKKNLFYYLRSSF